MATAGDTIVVLNPTAASGIKEREMASRIGDLNGKVIGFLENNKPNADIFLARVEELLSQRFKLAGTMPMRKKRRPQATTSAASEEEIAELAEKRDAVVTGMGD